METEIKTLETEEILEKPNLPNEELLPQVKLLNEREKRILRLRLGIGGKARTLDELGKEYGITRERVRQIELKALNKLRYPNRAGKPRDYIGQEVYQRTLLEEDRDIIEGQDERQVLNPREKRIMRLRFGIGFGGEPRTLDEVGKELGITRERVRQIEAAALRKMRPLKGKLLNYLY